MLPIVKTGDLGTTEDATDYALTALEGICRDAVENCCRWVHPGGGPGDPEGRQGPPRSAPVSGCKLPQWHDG